MDKKTKPFAHQDWSQDFFMPKKSTAKTTEKKIADAMKRGDGVIAVKKGTANKKGLGISVRKEMESEEIKDPGHVGYDLGVAIVKARQKKEMKQSDLAKEINEKISVVMQYETGKAIPSGEIIVKMEKALDCRLPRPKKKKVVKKKSDWDDDDF